MVEFLFLVLIGELPQVAIIVGALASFGEAAGLVITSYLKVPCRSHAGVQYKVNGATCWVGPSHVVYEVSSYS